MHRISILAVFAALLACGSGSERPSFAPQRSTATVVPTNYTCSTVTYYLGRSFGSDQFVIQPPVPGLYQPIDAANDSITLNTADGITFSWSSTAIIRAIFIRADLPGTPLGDATNQLWLYANPSGGGTTVGGGIYTEDNTNTRYPAKYIEFCFDAPPPPPTYSLQVTKTANTGMNHKYNWNLAKTSDVQSLTLAKGETFPVNYEVTAQLTGYTESTFTVSGAINIHNPAPIAATINAVTDSLATANCGVTFPYVLASGGDLTCTYTRELPDKIDGTNTAEVTTSGAVLGASASAAYVFASATVSETDRCANITDTFMGVLGQICAPTATMQFTYLHTVGAYEACGAFQVDNTATLTPLDTQVPVTASVSIPVNVPCEGGCTLTPGYWKTHSKYGPAPYDDTWALIGEDTVFFLSGKTWYTQFGNPPAGNAYWQLSHAYAAAALNVLNGAGHSAIDTVLAQALALLQSKTPAQVATLSGSDRAKWINAAAALDAWNNGLTGPGHCSE